MIDTVMFEDVRCFRGRHELALKPVTILVGENSTGKTTFLSLVRAAHDLAAYWAFVDFNEEPFLLGTFDQIASYRAGSAGRAKDFVVGSTVAARLDADDESASELADVSVTARFSESSIVTPREWVLSARGYSVSVHAEENQSILSVTTPSGLTYTHDLPSYFERRLFTSGDLLILASGALMRGGDSAKESQDQAEYEKVQQILGPVGAVLETAIGPRPLAMAPIRSRPQRVYEPLKDTPEPEGSHAPVVLARILAGSSERSARVRSQLESYGMASGLYDHISIRQLGRKKTDPFQIRAGTGGPDFNLVDVGYGVSQSLPIVVEALNRPQSAVFLVQQPEVHLHPRAQAALGSLFMRLAKEDSKRFVVETHSDYIVDRIRMEVRDGATLSADDVAILYFERTRQGTKIHTLHLDGGGNIVDAPAGYRRFFLDEERRFLGG